MNQRNKSSRKKRQRSLRIERCEERALLATLTGADTSAVESSPAAETTVQIPVVETAVLDALVADAGDGNFVRLSNSNSDTFVTVDSNDMMSDAVFLDADSSGHTVTTEISGVAVSFNYDVYAGVTNAESFTLDLLGGQEADVEVDRGVLTRAQGYRIQGNQKEPTKSDFGFGSSFDVEQTSQPFVDVNGAASSVPPTTPDITNISTTIVDAAAPPSPSVEESMPSETDFDFERRAASSTEQSSTDLADANQLDTDGPNLTYAAKDFVRLTVSATHAIRGASLSRMNDVPAITLATQKADPGVQANRFVAHASTMRAATSDRAAQSSRYVGVFSRISSAANDTPLAFEYSTAIQSAAIDEAVEPGGTDVSNRMLSRPNEENPEVTDAALPVGEISSDISGNRNHNKASLETKLSATPSLAAIAVLIISKVSRRESQSKTPRLRKSRKTHC